MYIFDGLPHFLSDGVMHTDHNLIGAFCGTTRNQPITVEAKSGKRFCDIFIPFKLRRRSVFVFEAAFTLLEL